LGLSEDVHRLLNKIGLLDFMLRTTPTYERITLEFLSTVEYEVHTDWERNLPMCTGAITFQLFQMEHRLMLEELGAILGIPVDGPGKLPSDFKPDRFWTKITGTEYIAKDAKASQIHNPCFRYVQKCLAYSMFGRGDSQGVISQTELFFMSSMISETPVNVAAFVAAHLSKVGKAVSGDICVGGIITQIATFLGYDPVEQQHAPVAGMTKLDILALINQLVIQMNGTNYEYKVGKTVIMNLPNPERTSTIDEANWRYREVFRSNYQFQRNEENEHLQGETGQSSQGGHKSSSFTSEEWKWIHGEFADLRGEQARQSLELHRQGDEQTRQGVMMTEMHSMMQQLMLHFPPPPQ